MIKFIVLIIFFFTPSFWVDAAEFRLQAEETTFGMGDEFLVTVSIDTEGEQVNAFEGMVVFPEELLNLIEIREKNSIVNLWVKDPPEFSGLTPGGYNGKGVLFSLIFEAKAEGEGIIGVEQGNVLLNDGKGTSASLQISNFKFLIPKESRSGDPMGQVSKQRILSEDTEPPEAFELKLAEDPSVFDGKPFLVFAARDKNSGIHHYEISFVHDNNQQTVWARAESPYLLGDQKGVKQVFVKAVDRAGNERIASLSISTGTISFFAFLLWGNTGILIGIGGFMAFWLWKRRNTTV